VALENGTLIKMLRKKKDNKNHNDDIGEIWDRLSSSFACIVFCTINE
jgi:hypothetical protein